MARPVLVITRVRALLVILLASLLVGCDGGKDTPGDARTGPGKPPPNCMHDTTIACLDSVASFVVRYFDAANHCQVPADVHVVPCAMGCTVEGQVLYQFDTDESRRLMSNLAALCAETPEAMVGAVCAGLGSTCIPTRSALNMDGTVAGRTDLRCDGTCVVKSSNMWAPAPCEASITQNAAPGVIGFLPIGFLPDGCLLAWNETTQKVASARTRACVGDWQCSNDALCDDQIPILPAGSTKRFAVCKPGPRGTLTPAMLVP